MQKMRRLNVALDMLFFGACVCLLLVTGVMKWTGDSGFQTSSVYVLVVAILCFDVGVLANSAFHMRRDLHMLLFVLVYNVLLLGRVYFNCIYYRHRLLDVLEAEGWQQLYLAILIIFVGLVAFVLAYFLIGPIFRRRERQVERGERSPQKPVVPVLRQLSRVALYVTSIPFFYVLAIQAYTVVAGGYAASFTHTVEIPSLISRLSTLFVPSFVLFLGTLPSLRQMIGPLVVYGVYMGASLLTGRRSMLVTEAIMLFLYFVMRDALRPKERRRLTWKWAIPVAVVGVVGAYLLQQIEEYDGVCILATNLIGNIDEAFMRRITYVVHFPFPDRRMREDIYRHMMPPAAPLAEDIDWGFLAEKFELSGGHIKNIVLSAAFMAAGENSPIGMRHLLRAAVGEMKKNEIVVVREELREYADLLEDEGE